MMAVARVASERRKEDVWMAIDWAAAADWPTTPNGIHDDTDALIGMCSTAKWFR